MKKTGKLIRIDNSIKQLIRALFIELHLLPCTSFHIKDVHILGHIDSLSLFGSTSKHFRSIKLLIVTSSKSDILG